MPFFFLNSGYNIWSIACFYMYFDLFLVYLIVLGYFITRDRLEALLCCFDAESVHCQERLCFIRQTLVNEKFISWKSIHILKGNYCLDFSLTTGLIAN